jgi:cytochrome c oxidase cbb3-type subunit III
MKAMKVIAIVIFFVGIAAMIGARHATADNPGLIQGEGPRFDQAAVERGQQVFVAQCGFCHGSNATGGQSGPDLIRSVLVIGDEGGKQLGEFLKVGRPDKGMPRFDLKDEQVKDMATFLHQRIYAVADRGSYKILNILVGDAKEGETYFNGEGKCNTCHSPSGDLQGIGSKYDPVALQGRIVMPRGRGFGGRRRGAPDAQALRTFPTVTVTLPSGKSFNGLLLGVTDFNVVLRDAEGVYRSFTRDGDTPKVEVKDPLQAHVDMLAKWKDSDLHNMTAYLVTLK